MARTYIGGDQVEDETLTGEDILDESVKAVDIDIDDLSLALREKSVTNISSTPYTVIASDLLIVVDATVGDIVINLPLATDVIGRELKIMKNDSSDNAVVVTPSGTDTVMHNDTKEICYQNTLMIINSDGVGNWI